MKAEALYVPHPPGEWFPGYTKEDMRVLDAFAPEGVSPTPGFVTDFMGCKTRTSTLYRAARAYDNKVWSPPIPGALFEAAEWIGLLKSVLTAKETFAAMELGAGWGPVIVASAHAARMRGISTIFLCGVEADPGRFALMEQHLRDNGFDPSDHELVMAAVGSQAGKARWPRIFDPTDGGGARPVREGNLSDVNYMPLNDDAIEVNIVAFSELLRKRATWDLVHVDVQGWEFELCQNACGELNTSVKWLVIGTHSRKIDGDLIALLYGQRWVLENEKPTVFQYDASQKTLEGMTTIDGIQVWRNSKLDGLMNAGPDEKGAARRWFHRMDFSHAARLPDGVVVPSSTDNGHSNEGCRAENVTNTADRRAQMTQSGVQQQTELERFQSELRAESETQYQAFRGALENFRNWSKAGWLPSQLSDLTIWDVGCGSGVREAVFYFNGCRNILGLDVARREIPQAIRSLPGVRFEVCELADLKEDAKPDLITTFNVTEHVANLPAFCLDCYKALRPGGLLFVSHDNYYQPVGHHDHGFLFIDAQTNCVRFQGTACWETEEKCAASAQHRQTLLQKYPNSWSPAFDTELTPLDCNSCRYRKRSQPWAHLIFQDEFTDLFPEFFRTDAGVLNKVTVHQLRQWLIEAGFSIEDWTPHILSNEIPPELLASYQKDDLLMFQVMVGARKAREGRRAAKVTISLVGDAPTNVDLLREKVFGRPWFHRIDLGHGIVTPGVDDSPMKLSHIGMPEDLTGKSVLDIGAYDGFFSFEAERRGASRVVAADSFAWSQPTGIADGQGFKIAHEALNSRVEQKLIAVEDISPETVGMFDLVLFLGVFYHAPDPFRYLRAAASVCREMMILETHVDGLHYERPIMVFYPGKTLNNDPTNKWGPNLLCVESLLKEVGFKGGHFLKTYNPSRIVAHAFRQ